MEFTTYIRDKEYIIDVTYYIKQAGNTASWDSPDDYYGYCDMEYDIYDIETHQLVHPEMTDAEADALQVEVEEFMESINDEMAY